MLLPLKLIWLLNISHQQKFGLAAIFSLGTIIVVFAFVRLANVTRATAAATTNPLTVADGPILLSMWSDIECGVAVFVVNLPAFRSLLRTRGNTTRGSSKKQGTNGSSNYSIRLQNQTQTVQSKGTIDEEPYSPHTEENEVDLEDNRLHEEREE
jgi:hypothetical protein